MSAARVCKFGYQCHRPDCWFSHPEGRQIDQSGGGGGGGGGSGGGGGQQQQYVLNNNAQNYKSQEASHAPMIGFAPHQVHHPPSAQSSGGAAAAAYRSVTRPLTPHNNGSAASSASATAQSVGSDKNSAALNLDTHKGVKICKFGRDCHRQDCYFAHPDGRKMDDSPSGNSSATSTPKPKKGGGSQTGSDDPTLDDYDLEDAIPDGLDDKAVEALVTSKEWFPASKDCSCCKGYIHDCESATCQSLGKCGCAFAYDNDEDGGGAANKPDETWKDEFFGLSRACKCCEGYVYRCKLTQPVCKSSGKCFCQSAPSNTPATSAAASASATAAAPAAKAQVPNVVSATSAPPGGSPH